MRTPFPLLLAGWCCSTAAYGGILISRTGQGLEFTDAAAVTINGKDKALSLGGQPKVSGQISKLPATRLNVVLLRDMDSGVPAHYEQGKAEYLLPQGLPKTAPADAAAIWKTSKISYKKSEKDKVGAEVATDAFVAFLPAGAEDLTGLCMDGAALELIGGKGKGFPAQMELMSAAVKAYSGNQAIAPLAKYVEDSMRGRYEQFESGAAGLEALTQGLKLVELSRAVYPADGEQEKLRAALTGRKQWLDRKAAILRAFAAAEEWDAFLLGDREFERYQQSFPDLTAKRAQALAGSLQLHQQAGAQRKSDGDYGGAYHEYLRASNRKPSDAVLREEAMQAWTEYSRREATRRQADRAKLQPGQQGSIERYLYNASQYKAGKNLSEALKSVQDAEAMLRKSLPPNGAAPETLNVLYEKAEILGTQERMGEALKALDEYDLYAVDEERSRAEKLRNQLLFKVNAAVKDLKGQFQAAWASGRYHRAYEAALLGLAMKSDDAELLYDAGVASWITRKPKESRAYLERYLEISNTLDARAEERAQVRRLLPAIGEPAAAGQGDRDCLSGETLPPGVFYSPTSLAFQPHIERIDASNKLKTTFEWDGGKLNSVTPVFDKNDHVTPEAKISLGYDARGSHVEWASDGDEARPAAPTDPDEAYQRATPLLRGNPYVDLTAIEKLAGKKLALGIAGNRFFNPLVWEKLYYFRLTYDDSGRVSRAEELSGPRGEPKGVVLEFDWSGMQLNAIRGFQGTARIYQRSMQYQDGRLVSEEIQGSGKASHIKYTYNGNRLVSAEAANDPTLDNRSRKVAFAGNPASAR